MKSKVGIVVRREFLMTVKRPSYLIATLGMPLIAVLVLGISILPALLMARKEMRLQTLGIVDRSGALQLDSEVEFTPPVPPALDPIAEVTQLTGSKGTDALARAFSDASRIKLRPYASLELAQQALRREEISAVVEFAPDYVTTGRVSLYTRDELLGSGSSARRDLLGRFAVERLLAGKLDPALMERVRRPMRTAASYTLKKDGTFERENVARQVASFAVPLGFTTLFFISVMMSSGFLLQGVSEEKENRVIEVILSSIDSDGLLLGKLIGLGGAGLLQIMIWVVISQVLLLASLAFEPGAGAIAALLARPFSIVWSFVFYLLGYLLLGVLLTGTGSLGQNLKESQQYGMMWTLGSVVPMASLMLLLSEPNGLYARILSFVPITSPVTMFLRLNSKDPPSGWEVLLVAVVLALAVWISLKLMARIFRVGLLLYGKRPTIPEIIRLLRRPAA